MSPLVAPQSVTSGKRQALACRPPQQPGRDQTLVDSIFSRSRLQRKLYKSTSAPECHALTDPATSIGAPRQLPLYDPRQMAASLVSVLTGLFSQLHSHLIDPISMEILRDPLRLSCGHLVGRRTFEEWSVSSGRSTCPLDRQEVTGKPAEMLVQEAVAVADLWERLSRTGLLEAITANDVATVGRFLAPRPFPKERELLGAASFLHLAAKRGWHAMLEVLLRSGLQDWAVNTEDGKGCVPLHLAAGNGSDLGGLELLLNHPNCSINAQRHDGSTPFMVAVDSNNVAAVQRLLEESAVDFNKPRYDGLTPLMVAAQRGNLPLVMLLLKRPGIEATTTLPDGTNALHMACSGGHPQTALRLISHPSFRSSIDARDAQGRTPWLCAAEGQHNPALREQTHAMVLQVLATRDDIDIEATDRDGRSALHLAAQHGHRQAIALLRGMVTNPNKRDFQGNTALMLAAQNGHAHCVGQLLETPGVNPHLKNHDRQHCLHVACAAGQTEVVRRLMELGRVDIQARDKHGRTPMDLAERRGDTAIMAMLAERRQLPWYATLPLWS